jgi:hypothetical protein
MEKWGCQTSPNCVLECSLLLLQWMWSSENLYSLNGGGWGYLAPTTILAVAVDGTPDSLVVHRTWHCSVSGACHVSCSLGFGAVDHWIPLSCSCTGQSGATPDMSGASWHLCSNLWLRTVHLYTVHRSRPLAHLIIGPLAHRYVRCTPDSPVNYSRACP